MFEPRTAHLTPSAGGFSGQARPVSEAAWRCCPYVALRRRDRHGGRGSQTLSEIDLGRSARGGNRPFPHAFSRLWRACWPCEPGEHSASGTGS